MKNMKRARVDKYRLSNESEISSVEFVNDTLFEMVDTNSVETKSTLSGTESRCSKLEGGNLPD